MKRYRSNPSARLLVQRVVVPQASHCMTSGAPAVRPSNNRTRALKRLEKRQSAGSPSFVRGISPAVPPTSSFPSIREMVVLSRDQNSIRSHRQACASPATASDCPWTVQPRARVDAGGQAITFRRPSAADPPPPAFLTSASSFWAHHDIHLTLDSTSLVGTGSSPLHCFSCS